MENQNLKMEKPILFNTEMDRFLSKDNYLMFKVPIRWE